MKRINRLSTIFENEDEILVIVSQKMIDKLKKEIESTVVSIEESGFFDDGMNKRVLGVRHRATDFFFISIDDVDGPKFEESIKEL